MKKNLFTAKKNLSLKELHKRQEKVLELAEKANLTFFGYANNARTRMTIGIGSGKENELVIGWVADVETGKMKSLIPSNDGINIPTNLKKVADVLNTIKKLS